jgi:hypothetical protein
MSDAVRSMKVRGEESLRLKKRRRYGKDDVGLHFVGEETSKFASTGLRCEQMIEMDMELLILASLMW